MAGHSHAKNVRLRKAAVDSKRSKLFSKMSRLIISAARAGGGDPAGNAKLAFAISKAKSVSLPKDTIEKAIKKGTGELEGDNFEELLYEGYGPGGAALLIEILSDNRNRTASEIRKIMDTRGGKLGTANCVAFMFQRKGLFLVDAEGRDEMELLELLMDHGVEDIRRKGDFFEILCEPTQFDAVNEVLQAAGIKPEEADQAQVADTLVPVDLETGKKLVRLIDALEDNDDVQNVYTNADIPEEAYED